MKRKFFVIAPLILAVAGLGLSGCSNSALPTPVAAPPSAHPALTAEKLDSINKSIFATIKETDSSLDVDKLASRMSGPALAGRRLDYQKKTLLGDGFSLPPLSDKLKSSAVSQASSYPRIAVEVMQAPEGANRQRLHVLIQPTARSNWTLWGVMQILSDAEIPIGSTGKGGLAVIQPDDSKGLVASPNAVVDAYIQLVKTGNDASGLTFAADDFRAHLEQSQKDNAEAVKDIGEASVDIARGADGPFALRTKNGGALVITELNYTSVIRNTKTGGSITIKAENNQDIPIVATGEANKDVKFSGSMTAYYTTAVAFYVPPAKEKDAAISLIAASTGVPFKVDVQ